MPHQPILYLTVHEVTYSDSRKDILQLVDKGDQLRVVDVDSSECQSASLQSIREPTYE